MGKTCFGWVEIWVDTGQVNKGKSKKSLKTIDIVSYALEMSVNCVTCVFVVHVNWLNSGHPCVHQKCVTGKNVILHKALRAT